METNEINRLLCELASAGLERAVVSNPPKTAAEYTKITIEPKTIKGALRYQLAYFTNTSVKHENIAPNELPARLMGFIAEGYRQLDLYTSGENIKILTNKNTSRIIRSKAASIPAKTEHNRQKNYIIREGEPAEWLVALGVMEQNGRVLADYQKKFRQFNRFLEFLADVEEHIPDGAEIVDFGCGKAYLSFAAYYYFSFIKKKNVSITGLDLKREVVENCQKLAGRLGYERLRFICGDIADYEHDAPRIDMVITLHACDTATDLALAFAIERGVKVIMSVPCCQHELNPQLKNELLSPVLRHGILRERFAAILTDAIRTEVLGLCGYKTVVAEFIELEHTPKNIMLRAVKGGKRTSPEALFKLLGEFGATQTLADWYRKREGL